jgi:hypothetical protein
MGAKGDTIKEVQQRVAEMTALGRAGVPDDIGPMIAALLSDENRWVNGSENRSVRRHGAVNAKVLIPRLGTVVQLVRTLPSSHRLCISLFINHFCENADFRILAKSPIAAPAYPGTCIY